MKILLLDPQRKVSHRISKDTSGGYGTGNDFGSSIISKLINSLVSKMINMPPMYSMYIFSILKKNCQHKGWNFSPGKLLNKSSMQA